MFQYWNELKHQAAFKHSSSTYIETDNYKHDSVYLRDKSASCGHGLELTQRPVTYPKQFDKTLLMNGTTEIKNSTEGKKKVNFQEKKIIFEEKINEFVPKSVTVNTNEMKRELSSIKEISSSSKDIEISTLLKDSNFVSSSLNLNNEVPGQSLEKSISVNSLTLVGQSEEPIKFIDETVDEMYDRSHMNPEWKNEIIEELIGSLKKSCFSSNEAGINNTTPSNSPDKNIPDKTIDMAQAINTNLIPQKSTKPVVLPRNQINETKVFKKPPDVPAKPDMSRKPAVPPRNFTTKITRGRLDKSHSTPAYDTTQETEKIVPEPTRTPEILVTAPEPITYDYNVISEFEDKIEHSYTQIEYHVLPQGCETTPVVETINSALDIRGSFKYGESVDHYYQQKSDETKIPKNTPHDAEDRRKSYSHSPKLGSKFKDSPPEPPPRTLYMQNADSKKPTFEPKNVSTPITKPAPVDFPSVDTHKNTAEVTKSKSETKISPTNSVVRAMIYSNKSKSGKKKSALLASKC